MSHRFMVQLEERVSKGLLAQAIFVAATRCNFCCAKIASSFKHVRNPCDIVATNRTKNCTWFTRAILKLQLERNKNILLRDGHLIHAAM